MKIPRTVITPYEPENKEVLWIKQASDEFHYTMYLFGKHGWTPVAADTLTVEQLQETLNTVAEHLNTLNDTKQDKLISGENIKTINNESLLSSGNINTGVLSIKQTANDLLFTIDGENYIPFCTISPILEIGMDAVYKPIGTHVVSANIVDLRKRTSQVENTLNSIKDTTKTIDANAVLYDDTHTQLNAMNTQAAIEGLYNRVVVISEEDYENLVDKDDNKIYMLYEE